MAGDDVSTDTLSDITGGSNDTIFKLDNFDELEGEYCIDHNIERGQRFHVVW